MKNWVTFFSGLALLLTGVILFLFVHSVEGIAMGSACVLGGIGIMSAKQSNVIGAGRAAKKTNRKGEIK